MGIQSNKKYRFKLIYGGTKNLNDDKFIDLDTNKTYTAREFYKHVYITAMIYGVNKDSLQTYKSEMLGKYYDITI